MTPPHTPLKDKFFLVFRPHFEQFFFIWLGDLLLE